MAEIDSVPDGRRKGRPSYDIPAKVETFLLISTHVMTDEGVPWQTLEEIAEKLNADDETPRPGGGPWTPTSVKTAFRGVRQRQLTLLRRMGSMLEAIRPHALSIEMTLFATSTRVCTAGAMVVMSSMMDPLRQKVKY